MPSRFLRTLQPLSRILPEAKEPGREVSFKEKLLWTFLCLIIYLIMSNVPLYGVAVSQETDYFYWMRVIMASSKGTLTELGIGPIVTSGLIMQLLAGSKIINVDMSDPIDRGQFTGAQKVITMILTTFQAIIYITGGAFGQELGVANGIWVFVQLFSATIIIMLLDEILQRGWGMGSGVSLFIAAGVAGQIVWNAFSMFPVSQPPDGDGMARGAIVCFFQTLFDPNSSITWYETFIRQAGSPGMIGVLTTILIFGAVMYVESMRIEIPLSYAGYRGMRGKYPMKLMYVSNIPVILAQAGYSTFLYFAQIVAGPNSNFRGGTLDVFLNIVGTFDATTSGQIRPTGGIAWLLTPPQGLGSIIEQLNAGGGGLLIIHSVLYLMIFIVLCIFLGRIWVEVSGLAPRDIAAQIIDSKMEIAGFRRSEKVIEKILKRYIPTLTILNGIIVGLLSFSADFLGALGSGTGLLLMVGIMQNYAETIAKEAAAEQYPSLSGFLG
ncbi:MAG: preprotein translocase subunit SecY [Promethearchaeota archaeon]